jgi:hypothetical protein
MRTETRPTPLEPRAASRASERRMEALVAAYIHELSSRHSAARRTAGAEPDAGELRS